MKKSNKILDEKLEKIMFYTEAIKIFTGHE